MSIHALREQLITYERLMAQLRQMMVDAHNAAADRECRPCEMWDMGPVRGVVHFPAGSGSRDFQYCPWCGGKVKPEEKAR